MILINFRNDTSNCKINIKIYQYTLFYLLYLLLYPVAVNAAVYHIDSEKGDDQNNGSISQPWKTVVKANKSTFSPGDKILLKRGSQWNNTFIFPSSGSAEQPITLGSYGDAGPSPLLDGSTPVNGNWLQLTNNIYMHTLKKRPSILFYKDLPQPPITTITLNPSVKRIPEPGAILLQIKQKTPYTNFLVTSTNKALKEISGISNFHDKLDTVRQIKVRQINEITGKEEFWKPLPPPVEVVPKRSGLKTPGNWFWRDGVLFLFSNTHPDKQQVSVGSLNFGIHTNKKQYLNIRDIHIKGANKVGMMISGTRHSLIENIKVYGIGDENPKSAIMLEDSSHNQIINNTIENVLGIGIALYGFSSLTHYNTIGENRISSTGSSAILIGGEVPFRVANNLITGNTIMSASQISYDSAGIYLYFCAGGNILEKNIIINGGTDYLKSSGIMADTDSGPVTIRENTIENNSFGGITVTEKQHQILGNKLIRNTRTQWDNAEITFFPVNDNVSQCEIRDNYIESENLFVKIAKGSEKNHIIDNNKYVGGSNKPFFWNKSKLFFSNWQKKTGHDLHSEYLQH